MFQWSITLSDKQVIMLTAFHMAIPDKNGSIFHSAHSMVADAWDIRSVRKLEESNLIQVIKNSVTLWSITAKGRLIAQAIMCDADNLRRLKSRKGHEMRCLTNTENHRAWMERKAKKRAVKHFTK